MTATKYFRARHVATIVSPLIEDGCVVVQGDRIVAVGPARDIKPPRIDEDVDGLLMPGLINMHTHLELTNVARPERPGTFQDWLLTTMGAMREVDAATFNHKREEAVYAGIAQCLKFGVTTVGDISQNVEIVRPILRNGPIRSISYGECLGIGERRLRFEMLLEQAAKYESANSLMNIGVSPHAPYTVDAKGYKQAWDAFTLDASRLTTHIAETPDEAEFIRVRSGPFAALYERLGFSPGPPDEIDGSPVKWLHDCVHLREGDLLAHVNYCSDDDLALLRRRRVQVVWCPRTHAYFGHPPHRWKDMLSCGINVCIGTDSCASSGDLNIVDDLRLVHRQSPEVPPSTLWETVTLNPSRQTVNLNSDHSAGSIEVTPARQKVGDMISWPTRSNDPLREILETPTMLPSGVWIGGNKSYPSPSGRG